MKTKQQKLASLKTETLRLLERIEEAEKELKQEWPSPHVWSAVKRASLDLGREGVKFRKW